MEGIGISWLDRDGLHHGRDVRTSSCEHLLDHSCLGDLLLEDILGLLLSILLSSLRSETPFLIFTVLFYLYWQSLYQILSELFPLIVFESHSSRSLSINVPSCSILLHKCLCSGIFNFEDLGSFPHTQVLFNNQFHECLSRGV